MKKYDFLKLLQESSLSGDFYDFEKINVDESIESSIAEIFAIVFPDAIVCTSVNTIKFYKQDLMPPEAYTILIDKKGIKVSYKDYSGILYAAITLRHMLSECVPRIPCGQYSDYPQFPVRGLLYDISRNKVPTLETLLRLVDILVDLKYNQLQLYVEGLSFEYSSYEKFLCDQCYITKEEVRQLNDYCKLRCIDLVPNHNTLGHMGDWLAVDEFKPLARNPEGEFAFGRMQAPAVLDPENDESKIFIQNLTEDMLEVYDSPNFNVNLDEAFGLEEASLYADWASFMNSLCKKHGKRMLMWSDMINVYPQLQKMLPKNAILLDWGYEDHYPFNIECSILKESGYDFWVCPGTSSWCSISGRTDNMIGNTNKALDCALKYGAKGIIATDWGDAGHWQTFPIAVGGIAYIGLTAWLGKPLAKEELSSYLNTHLYQDKNNSIGLMSLEIGNMYHFDDIRLVNASFIHHQYKMGLCTIEEKEAYIKNLTNWMIPYVKRFGDDGGSEMLEQLTAQKEFDFNAQMDFIAMQEKELHKANAFCADAMLIIDEFQLTIDMMRFSLFMRQYIENQNKCSKTEKREILCNLQERITDIIHRYKLCWLKRNKVSALEKSMEDFIHIQFQIENALEK